MEMQSYYMQALMEMDVGIAPQPTDVIIGKGYRFQNHPGTKYYRSITAREKLFYDMQRSASIRARRAIAEKIVDEICHDLNQPGRFLKKNEQTNCYEELGREVAIKKVWQALRDRKKSRRLLIGSIFVEQ